MIPDDGAPSESTWAMVAVAVHPHARQLRQHHREELQVLSCRQRDRGQPASRTAKAGPAHDEVLDNIIISDNDIQHAETRRNNLPGRAAARKPRAPSTGN